MGCDEIQGLDASTVNPRRGAADPDGQWEADRLGKCWKPAAFPLEWKLHLSLGMTPKAVLGEEVSSQGAGKGVAGRELAQQVSVSTLCVQTPLSRVRGHTAHTRQRTSRAVTPRTAKPGA